MAVHVSLCACRVTAVLAFAATLAACSEERGGFFISPSASARVSAAAAAPPKPSPPPIDMAGRWTLAAAGAGACAMNFTAPPEAAEGAIAPEGGCPGDFFTSRRWSFEGGRLLIKDHRGRTLASLPQAGGAARFEGEADGGLAVVLTR
jgi:hypothetical protein